MNVYPVVIVMAGSIVSRATVVDHGAVRMTMVVMTMRMRHVTMVGRMDNGFREAAGWDRKSYAKSWCHSKQQRQGPR